MNRIKKETGVLLSVLIAFGLFAAVIKAVNAAAASAAVHTVTYYVDEISGTATFGEGEDIILPEQTKTGWEFIGWFMGKTGIQAMPQKMPAYDITVYARYSPYDYNVRYYVQTDDGFVQAGTRIFRYGDEIERNLAEIGDSAELFELCENDFDGPYTDDTFETEAPVYMPERSISVYYRLSPKMFTVKFDLGSINVNWSNGSKTISVNVRSGEQISVPSEFESIKNQAARNESKNFTGWDDELSAMSSEIDGKVYTAGWETVDGYLVTFYDHKGVVIYSDFYSPESQLDEFDSDQINIEGPYKFKGWAAEQGGAVVYAAGELAGTPVTAPADYYAVVEKTAKLVAKDETSTAMVERAGVVETYNEDFEKVPYGVTSVVRTFEDSCGDYAEPDDTWFVYGLKVGIKAGELGDYVKVTNGGSFKVYKGETEIPAEATVGTGAVIKVYDSEGAEAEKFFVVIYGDVDGKSNINGTDRSVVSADIENRTWSNRKSDKYVPCRFRAADLDQKGNVNGTDRSSFTSFIEGSKTVNQITGRAE